MFLEESKQVTTTRRGKNEKSIKIIHISEMVKDYQGWERFQLTTFVKIQKIMRQLFKTILVEHISGN